MNVSDELIQKVLNEEVEEVLLTDNTAVGAALTEPTSGKHTIPTGYEGVVVSLAVSSDDTVNFFLKRDEKQYYSNGLNCGALSDTPETSAATLFGVGKEVPLLVKVKEKGVIQVGFTRTGGAPTVSWRLRIRLFKKG